MDSTENVGLDDFDGRYDTDSGSSSGMTKRRGRGSKRSVTCDKESDEYKKRRERNNVAVKKSRTKSKIKAQETLKRVHSLQKENESLESKIKLLTKELSFLKDLFLAHAGSAHGKNLQQWDLTTLLGINFNEDNMTEVNADDAGEPSVENSEYTAKVNLKIEV